MAAPIDYEISSLRRPCLRQHRAPSTYFPLNFQMKAKTGRRKRRDWQPGGLAESRVLTTLSIPGLDYTNSTGFYFQINNELFTTTEIHICEGRNGVYISRPFVARSTCRHVAIYKLSTPRYAEKVVTYIHVSRYCRSRSFANIIGVPRFTLTSIPNSGRRAGVRPG